MSEATEAEQQDEKTLSRRDFISKVAATAGVILGYGLLTVQGVLFLMPRRLQPRMRRIFLGNLGQIPVNSVRTFVDPLGNELIIRRDQEGVHAFSSTCPHLGCRVRWEKDKNRFLCPCHMGIFNADGKATVGPPADAGQRLKKIDLVVEKKSGVIFVEVPDTGKA